MLVGAILHGCFVSAQMASLVQQLRLNQIIPNEGFGEEVKAVVQLTEMANAGLELGQELTDHCQSQLASYKCPHSIDFAVELPRHPTGKLYKRLLRDRYWP